MSESLGLDYLWSRKTRIGKMHGADRRRRRGGSRRRRAMWSQNVPEDACCLKVSALAAETYRALCRGSGTWRANAERLARVLPQAAEMLADVFFAFYDASAALRADVSTDASRSFAMLAAFMLTPEFRRTRERTRGDGILSALLALQVVEAFAVPPEDDRNRKGLRRFGLLGRTLGQEEAPRAPGRSAREHREEALLQYRASRAAKQAEQGLRSILGVREAWGILPGEKGVHALDDVYRLVEEVHGLKAWDELTEVLSRFRRLLGAVSEGDRAERRPGFDFVAGYTLGRELGRLAPEEAVRIADPETEPLFQEAYEHRRLLELDFRGRSLRRPGPLICCMDTSASMNTPAALGRERFLWCKGIGLALLGRAREERRPYLGICFSSESELEAFSFAPGGFRPEAAVDMARCDFNGGTHFERPLLYALETAEGYASGERGADLVFVADGEAPVGLKFLAEFSRRKREAGLRLISVFIDGFNKELARISDAAILVDSRRLDSWDAAVQEVGRRTCRR